MTDNCVCLDCKQNRHYDTLQSDEEQIEFLNALSTVEKLRVITYDKSYRHIDELLDTTKVIDMKKLLYHIKSRASIDMTGEDYFTDISECHLKEVIILFSKYVQYQIDILRDCADEQDDELKEANFAKLSYMFSDEVDFILLFVLTLSETNEYYEKTSLRKHFVNTLMNVYYTYTDKFLPYVESETIKKFVEFHK